LSITLPCPPQRYCKATLSGRLSTMLMQGNAVALLSPTNIIT
jgi:hypothetical protein